MIPRFQRITIKHVARASGVSTQTVSRVINCHPDVSPETRGRVLKVIKQLDYQPSELARSLIHRRSYTLGVVTASLKNIGPNRTLNGITTQAEQLGYALLLKELPRFSVEYVQPVLKFMLGRQVDGILWAVQEVDNNRDWLEQDLDGLPVPILFLSRAPRPGIPMISIDNYAGGVLATQHLLERGRLHIAHLSGPPDWWESRQRKQGWQDTLETAGYPVRPEYCVEGDWSAASGQAAFQYLLETYPQMDAIFVANDQMALSILRVTHQRGIRVPEDLALVGYDNTAESAYFWPALTTVDQNQHELGGLAVQELVGKIEALHRDQISDPINLLIEPKLVIRESS